VISIRFCAKKEFFMSFPENPITSYLSSKIIGYHAQIEYLRGHKLTESDLNKKIFRIACGHLNPSTALLLCPVENNKRAFEVASRTLFEIKPDGSFIIEGLMRGSKQVMQASENDSNWITFDEAILALEGKKILSNL
jgi:hypothetical protein